MRSLNVKLFIAFKFLVFTPIQIEWLHVAFDPECTVSKAFSVSVLYGENMSSPRLLRALPAGQALKNLVIPGGHAIFNVFSTQNARDAERT